MILKTINTTNSNYLKLLEKCGNLFNQPTWLNIYSNQLKLIGIFNLNNELIGAFNLFEAKKNGFTYYITPPYSPSNSFFILNPAINISNKITFEKDIHFAIANYLNNLKGFLKITSFPSSTIDMQAYFWKKFKVIPNYTYQIDLGKNETEIYNNMTTEKRKSIRKAEKDNIDIKLCENYFDIKELILKTFTRKNKLISTQYLDKILFQYANQHNSFAYIAYQNNMPSACTFIIYDKNCCYYLFGGYDNANKHHGAGVGCMWQSILHAKKLNIKIFDFEGSMLPEVEKYFREFGGNITPYYTIQKAWLPIEIILKFKQRNRF